ncbi:MAG: YdiU family protein [Rickettsiales bacterium]|nr:YdiU family protein [Rickettsiales bacterium]
MSKKKTNGGWDFDHSYSRLSEALYTKVNPTPVREPRLVILNHALSVELGLDFKAVSNEEAAALFSGNELPNGAEPLSQAYAGHQFGHFTFLGDGRAHLLGEHITPANERFDIALKGSGRTPYGRRGDGRAALGPMLREYIMGEALHALGIATTRSLAVVTTGEPVYRETMLQGAVLTRVAASHVRVGTFEYLAAEGDKEGLKQLADYVIERHYPQARQAANPYLELLKSVMKVQAKLISEWMRVGFVHGVMNTDNMTICGETIDYGPCAMLDSYDVNKVFSSIDQMSRYAFGNQPHIAQWNLARFAETLLPLLHEEMEQSIAIAEETIRSFNELFKQEWLPMMRRKLGLFGDDAADAELIQEFLEWMQSNQADYTNSFRDLISETLPEGKLYGEASFKQWHAKWQKRLALNDKPISDAHELMRANNPVLIPRNHRVESALNAAEEVSDFSPLHELLAALSQPYAEQAKYAEFKNPPANSERVYQTFCGT